MHPSRVHNLPPRAGVDPISDADSAFITVSMAVGRPLRHETIALLADDARRGVALVVVNGTSRPDDVVEVLEFLTHPSAHGGRVGSIALATVRPGGRSDASDIDRWLEMSDLAEQSGIELLEWFVIGRDVTCPRDLLGEPPRW